MVVDDTVDQVCWREVVKWILNQWIVWIVQWIELVETELLIEEVLPLVEEWNLIGFSELLLEEE